MAGLTGIMDKFFGSGASHASSQAPHTIQQQQQPTPGNIPQGTPITGQQSQGTAPNGVIPQGTPVVQQQTQQDQSENKSPFAEFNNLWEPATGPDGKPLQQKQESLYNLDQQKVIEAAQRTDFKSFATPEQLAKVATGGQDGVAAMMDIMQQVASGVYAQAAIAATKIAESGINKAFSQAEQRLPGMIRNQQFSESLAAKNPALQDPAVKPMIDLVRNQMAQKYPTATSGELQEMAERYFQTAADVFNPQKQQQIQAENQRIQSQNDEWDRFFNQ